MKITNEQIATIEKIANDGYGDELVAYGADLYRSGLIKGAIISVSSIAIGRLIEWGIKWIKNKSRKKKRGRVLTRALSFR